MITKAQQEDALLDVVESIAVVMRSRRRYMMMADQRREWPGKPYIQQPVKSFWCQHYYAEGKEEGKLVRLVDELMGEKTLEVKLKTSCY